MFKATVHQKEKVEKEQEPYKTWLMGWPVSWIEDVCEACCMRSVFARTLFYMTPIATRVVVS